MAHYLDFSSSLPPLPLTTMTLCFFLREQRGNQSGALAWYDKALAAGWESQEGILNVMQVRHMTWQCDGCKWQCIYHPSSAVLKKPNFL